MARPVFVQARMANTRGAPFPTVFSRARIRPYCIFVHRDVRTHSAFQRVANASTYFLCLQVVGHLESLSRAKGDKDTVIKFTF